ncbi:MAG: hypothetical protein H8E15_04740 [Planctomycetes bacterium]|nr:hypothetical protein [Planctomycetota bacterium]
MPISTFNTSALIIAGCFLSSPTVAQGDRELIRELEFLPPDLHKAAIHDFDGDGVRDLIGGNPAASSGGLKAGRVQILSGMDGTPLYTLEGSVGDELGYAVTALGDQNGDGIPDLAASAPRSHGGDGSILILSGADAALLQTVTGNKLHLDDFGEALWDGGDYSGDGISEIIVRTNSVAAVIYDLQSNSVLHDLPLAGSLYWLDDMDGDGYSEILQSSNIGLNVYSTASKSNLWEAYEFFHLSGLAIPDHNGDGILDVAHFVDADLQFLDGRTGNVLQSVRFEEDYTDPSRPRLIGDLDGDQKGDIIAGSYNNDYLNAFSSTTGLHLWREFDYGGLGVSWDDEDVDGSPRIFCTGDGNEYKLVALRSGLLLSQFTLSASSTDTVELQINFSWQRSDTYYAILVSNAVAGSTWVNQFEIPLGLCPL